jgi:hypothetical protein
MSDDEMWALLTLDQLDQHMKDLKEVGKMPTASFMRALRKARAAGQHTPRSCLRCGADLASIMGVHVFVAGKPAPGGEVLCVEHGADGANGLTVAEYERLTAERQ